MSAPKRGLPDLTIWDSIQECATFKLAALTRTIETEISKDRTLTGLRATGSLRMAMESRARTWMVRGFACCLECWQTRPQQEDSAEFRSAVYFYGLSPFYSKQMLRLLRVAAGVSELTLSRLEEHREVHYGISDRSALHLPLRCGASFRSYGSKICLQWQRSPRIPQRHQA